MKLTKDTLKPGVYNERGRTVVVTKDDIDKLKSSVDVLHEAGYKIPFWMEHVPLDDRLSYPIKSTDSDLLSQAERDPWFGGWVTGMNLDSDDLLHTEIDVPDHLGSRLAGSGTFVSPQFGEWEEIKDRAPMALLHLAATRNPVNRDQTKVFHQKKSGSGLDGSGTSGQTAPDNQQLSLLEAMSSGVKTFSFSLSDAVGNQPTAGQQQPPTSGQQQPGQQIPGQPQLDPAGDLKTKLQQALQALGVTLDPNSAIHDNPEILTRLLSAIANAEGEAVEKTHESPTGPGGSTDPYSEHSTVIAMSKTQVTPETPVTTPAAQVTPAGVQATVPNPLEAQLKEQAEKIHQMSQGIVIQQTVNENLTKLLSLQKQKEYNQRIDGLVQSGRCTPAMAEPLKALSGTYQFSMTQSPDIKGELDLRLEVYESLPEGASWSNEQKTQQSDLKAHSFGYNGSSPYTNSAEPTEERADQIVQELFRMNGGGFVPPQPAKLDRQ